MNEAFEEKFGFRLSKVNVFVTVGMTAITLIVGTMMLIAFTSLREFIPGYTRPEIVELAHQNQIRIDSLAALVHAQDRLLFAMNMAISGEIPFDEIQDVRDSALVINQADIVFQRSREDSLLRLQVERSERFNLAHQPRPATTANLDFLRAANESLHTGTPFHTQSLVPMLFFVPLEGTIIADFDPKNNRFGIDITGRMNDAIKAVQNGVVISSEWTPNENYVIAIQHHNNIVSIYRHNSALLKRVGDFVRAGEPIAFIGSSGEGFRGPILNFELQFQGTPVNPRYFVPF